MQDQYFFITATWYYPDGVNCYEEIDSTTGPVALLDTLDMMLKWLKGHPMAFVEEGGAGILECSDDICGTMQQCARIE